MKSVQPGVLTPLGIDHIVLRTKDLEAMIAFYCDVIGCRVRVRLPDYGMVELEAGAASIALLDVLAPESAWARPEVSGGRNLDHLCLALGAHDEAALRRHLKEHGVEIVEEEVHDGPGGPSLSLYVRDPSGNVIELKAPPERK